MLFIVAPDSFKGSLSAVEATHYMERGIKAVFPQAVVKKVPLADGGEGTVEAIINAAGGRLLEAEVTGPLGRPVKAVYGVLSDGITGVLEVASVCGLPQVPPERRNPESTTSLGVGELILAAVAEGCRRVIVGLGGSATNDGGIGMAAALGIRFPDGTGRPLEPRVSNLAQATGIDYSGLDQRLAGVEVTGIYDVSSPLYGPRGASVVFGPQKGATPEQVQRLDTLLRRLAELIRQTYGIKVDDLPGAGAAGGLGAGLAAFLGGRLVPGSDMLLELCKLDEFITENEVDLVITGEGEINHQTVLGKVPVSVARLAKKHNLPVVALVGSIGPGYTEVYQHGINAVYGIIPRPMELSEAMQNAAVLLEEATVRLMRLWRLGCD
ncbi:glycerate kinase [Desulfotomaculum copahuensis]|uniref:Glycerate kinase n=1 Tax=Desulfotomaculum copahuensis TaxID=1838280 RepID=A0A1B7LJN5_9FIRM|nr:glycerate kinase [Desulfotomaculum copahuensis]OAT86682.1 glycerate kinase [Desulfotomaculum copahuensis]